MDNIKLVRATVLHIAQSGESMKVLINDTKRHRFDRGMTGWVTTNGEVFEKGQIIDDFPMPTGVSVSKTEDDVEFEWFKW